MWRDLRVRKFGMLWRTKRQVTDSPTTSRRCVIAIGLRRCRLRASGILRKLLKNPPLQAVVDRLLLVTSRQKTFLATVTLAVAGPSTLRPRRTASHEALLVAHPVPFGGSEARNALFVQHIRRQFRPQWTTETGVFFCPQGDRRLLANAFAPVFAAERRRKELPCNNCRPKW